MIRGPHHRRGLHLIGRATGFLRVSDQTFTRIDPEGLRRLTTVMVWIHWAVAIFFLVQLVYRPTYGMEDGIPYWLMLAALAAFSGYLHLRLRSNRPVTWRWVLGLMAMDVVLLSGAVVVGGGFDHFFFHLLFYPVLAGRTSSCRCRTTASDFLTTTGSVAAASPT